MINTFRQKRRKAILSTVDIKRINKEWLKKVKPKKRMTKKEYRRWKNKMRRLGVA